MLRIYFNFSIWKKMLMSLKCTFSFFHWVILYFHYSSFAVMKWILLILLWGSYICDTKTAGKFSGLLPNGDFELGPKPSQLKGSLVTAPNAIPSWTISGFVEYIKSGQKQGDMVLVVPEGAHAVRLGNEASIKQKVQLVKGMFYSLTFSAARTCAQEEKLNVSVVPTNEKSDWGVFSIQTMYGSNGWESFACGFRADFPVLEIVIHNPGMEEDPACGPLIDSVALKVLNSRRTRGEFSLILSS